jgi:hypothetical protein
MRIAFAAVLSFVLLAGTVVSQDRPPIPFEDPGACPFEGCVYREWIAKRSTTVRVRRSASSPIAFHLKAGERVQAITGVVVITKPGIVRFAKPWDAAPVHAKPGDVMYLLTYEGEGFRTIWFKGGILRGVDVTEFVNCGPLVGLPALPLPEDCAVELRQQPVQVWWAQLRNNHGQIGWTNRGREDFGKNNAISDN